MEEAVSFSYLASKVAAAAVLLLLLVLRRRMTEKAGLQCCAAVRERENANGTESVGVHDLGWRHGLEITGEAIVVAVGGVVEGEVKVEVEVEKHASDGDVDADSFNT